MHYVDEGPPRGEPIVCLHGEPTWGYLYRRMIPPLAERWRVLVPDHMGFGKSDTPQDREYSLRAHVENLAGWIDALDLRGITFVAQDWGGPIATQYTVRHPERVRRLFYANSLAGYGSAGRKDLPRLQDSRWFRWIGARPRERPHRGGAAASRQHGAVGDEAHRLREHRRGRRHVGARLLDAVRDARGVHRRASSSRRTRTSAASGTTWSRARAASTRCTAKPAMLAEGLRDHAIPPALAIADFEALWPGRPVVRLPGAGHFCQEDVPQTLVALIAQFLQST